MQNAQPDQNNVAARSLKPVVRIVVAAEIAISALLMTTVQWPAPQQLSAPQIASLR
ncbi:MULTISPECIES: hypothetical protein [Ensifer]|jgi:hypothetical protein|uniref:Uncharacterized protein n=1 Tax=Ensifer adhaerens TaxID=106592 RepID=A0A9Q8Y4J7_ENSAD|nr:MULTISPECIES: hypothetical protein [Ensifer]KSV69019.1 hypothetical protein N185_28440 [Sinorhizobium sp. GW3]MBD9541215.1 hypothetical protein [Ensifer sp. ENS04]MBD9625423.1 hypothetical protein [Ensifer sp. ENS06]MBW0368251.1 hypothetical protein [Ensifer adhaerens]RAS09031.1 hypothetical protein DEU52_11522 [Ensifer adhaerens]